MQINGEKFLNSIDKLNFKKNVFLISGNEEGLINKVKKIIIKKLESEKFTEIENTEGLSIDNKETLYSETQGLFFDKKITIHLNPKNIKIENSWLEYQSENAVFIIYLKTITGSKIKKIFDASKEVCSITCFKLSDSYKKQSIDKFFNKNSISMERSAYWFFIENSSEKYQLLENELNKILEYKTETQTITLNEIKKLLSLDIEFDFEDLFFEMFSSNKKIVEATNKIIKNNSDAYILLQKTKFYMDLIIKTKIEMLEKNDKEIKEKNFPRYLFRHKKTYNTLIDRLNEIRSIKCNELVKRTEVLLRKNDNMFLPICQRFLLNLKREIM